MIRRAGCRSGLTILEVVCATALAAMLFTAFGGVYATTSGVAEESHAATRARQDNLGGLHAVADLLRGAASASVSGFDAGGGSEEPTFQRVAGVDTAGRILDVPERLRWVPTTESVPGVAEPGEVVLEKGGVSSVVARRVPRGGFRVVEQGTSLRVSLTSYYATPRRTLFVTGETWVALRN